MRSFAATVALGVFLSAGMLTAQQTDSSQMPDAGIAQAAPAQPAQETGRMTDPGKQARHLAHELNLSADQEAQIRPVLADRTQQMQKLRDDPSLSPRDRRRKAREVAQETNSKIEALLTDAQKQQYEQMLAQRRAHRNGGAAAVPQSSSPASQ